MVDAQSVLRQISKKIPCHFRPPPETSRTSIVVILIKICPLPDQDNLLQILKADIRQQPTILHAVVYPDTGASDVLGLGTLHDVSELCNKTPQRDALVYSTKSLPVVPKDDEATNYSNTDNNMIEFRDWRKQNDRGRHRDIRQLSCGCSAEL